jgi:hypothetical protein
MEAATTLRLACIVHGCVVALALSASAAGAPPHGAGLAEGPVSWPVVPTALVEPAAPFQLAELPPTDEEPREASTPPAPLPLVTASETREPIPASMVLVSTPPPEPLDHRLPASWDLAAYPPFATNDWDHVNQFAPAAACGHYLLPRTASGSLPAVPCCRAGCGATDYCGVPPSWSAQAGGLALYRATSNASLAALATCTCAPGMVLQLNPADVELDWAGGTEVRLAHRWSCYSGIEFAFLGAWNWDDDHLFAGDDISVLGVLVGTGSGFITSASDLSSLEASYRHAVSPWTDLLIGFRWLELNEQTAIQASNAMGVQVDEQRFTDNVLYGGQVGVDMALYDAGGSLTIDALAVIGAYYNRITALSAGALPQQLQEDQTSYVGEVQVTAGYYLSQHLRATAGYRFLWIDGIASAPDQFLVPAGRVRDSSTAFFHGLMLGAEVIW